MLALSCKVTVSIILTLATAAAQDDDLYPPQELPQRLADPPRSKQFREWCGTFCLGPVEKATLHAFIRRGDAAYVVFSTVEARDEQHIHWVAIRGGGLIGYQRHYLESPWRPISGTIEGWKHGILYWRASGAFRRHGELVDEEYSGFFDPKTPDKGLQIRESHRVPRE